MLQGKLNEKAYLGCKVTQDKGQGGKNHNWSTGKCYTFLWNHTKTIQNDTNVFLTNGDRGFWYALEIFAEYHAH